MIVAVSDTGPLIHLAEIESLDLLSVIDELLVPETVYEELQQGGLPGGLSEVTYERVEANEERSETETELDPGETAALSVATEEDAVLLTDDLAARRAGKDAGIDVHGSIGVIALAFGREMVDHADAVARMRALQHETSLFITDAVVDRGIEQLHEE